MEGALEKRMVSERLEARLPHQNAKVEGKKKEVEEKVREKDRSNR